MTEIIDASWTQGVQNFPLQDCGDAWSQLVVMVLSIKDTTEFKGKRGQIADQMQRVASIATRVKEPASLDALSSPINAVRKHIPDMYALHMVLSQFTAAVNNLVQTRH